MARYIDADELYDEISDNYELDGIMTVKNALDFIDEQPTADVAPVKRGKWIATEYRGIRSSWFYEKSCSHCKAYTHIDADDVYYYCPNCGAKMEGVTE